MATSGDHEMAIDRPTSEDAAIARGVPGPLWSQWFRDRSGMP